MNDTLTGLVEIIINQYEQLKQAKAAIDKLAKEKEAHKCPDQP